MVYHYTFLSFLLFIRLVSSIVDTHVHLADITHNDYSFVGMFPDLNKNWTIADYTADTLNAGLVNVNAILMELEKTHNTFSAGLSEAQWFQSVGDYCNTHPNVSTCSPVAGLIASTPLEKIENLEQNLSELRNKIPLLRGIREGLWNRGPDFFLHEPFLSGVRMLAKFNLTFDLLVQRNQLKDVASLIEKVPEVKFNLNHVGYPPVWDRHAFGEWENNMAKISSFPNAYCKLSGLPQAAGAKNWTYVDFVPFISTILSLFKSNRINYAGNWFILNDFGEYLSMHEAVQDIFLDLQVSVADQNNIYHNTAIELYNLHTIRKISQTQNV